MKNLLIICFVSFGAVISTEVAEEAAKVEKESDTKSSRQGKLFKSDSLVVPKSVLHWPFSMKSDTSPQLEEMQGRFFNFMQATKSVTPLEMLVDCIKIIVPKIIDAKESFFDDFARWVVLQNNLVEFDIDAIIRALEAVVNAAVARIQAAAQDITPGSTATMASAFFF